MENYEIKNWSGQMNLPLLRWIKFQLGIYREL